MKLLYPKIFTPLETGCRRQPSGSQGVLSLTGFTIIILCFLGVLIYSNTFHSPFNFDDLPSIKDNLSIRDVRNLPAIWSFWPTRLLGFLSFALNYHFHRLDVFGYHLLNLSIHLGSAIAVWSLVLLILSAPAMKKEALSKDSGLIALFAGLIFLSHPLQTESVTYIFQRISSLSGFFYLLSISLYIKSRQAQIEHQPVSKWGFFYAFSLAFCIAAMLSKENAVTLPLMILLVEFCFLKTDKYIKYKYAVPFLITLPLIPLLLLFIKPAAKDAKTITDVLTGQSIIGGNYYLFSPLRIIITYLRLLFLPINQNLDYDYVFIKNINLSALASLFLLVVIFIAAVKAFPRYRLASFGIFWFFLTLLPETHSPAVSGEMFEHWLYLPLAGYSFFLVSSLYYLFGRKNLKRMAAILLVIVSCYSLLTYRRNLVWKDELSLWNDAVRKSPKKARPYYNRGKVYQNQGKLTQAISDYSQAIKLAPELAEAYNNRGLTYQTQGNLTQAISDFNRAIAINPRHYLACYNRGNVYQIQGSLTQALLAYNEAIEINPGYALSYNSRGVLYKTQGNLTQASSDFNRAIELAPDYAEAYNNRGLVYQAQGNLTQAISDFNRAIELAPDYAEAYNNRANLYLRQTQGSLTQAISDFNRAIELAPDLAQAYNNRAVAYLLKKEYNKSWEDIRKAEALGYKVNPEVINALRER